MPDQIRQTITRPCIGCDTPLDYQLTVWSDQSAPEILSPLGAVAFKGGHICHSCAKRCDRALSYRRTATEALKP